MEFEFISSAGGALSPILLGSLLDELQKLDGIPLREDTLDVEIVKFVLQPLWPAIDSVAIIWPVMEQQWNQNILAALSSEAHGPLVFAEVQDKHEIGHRSSSCQCSRSGDYGRPDPEEVASWLDRLRRSLIAAAPEAMKILNLRLLGIDDWEIAIRAGLGARLVRRIRMDAAASWAMEMKRC